jgi:hypothetical protein
MTRQRKGKTQGTPFEAYFAKTALPDSQPTLIFQHLQKTAGTALRRVIYANLLHSSGGEHDIEHVVLDVPKSNRRSDPLSALYSEWWDSLKPERRDRLILATSHSANYLIEHIERPVRAFTIVREPVDRVLSRYYFYSRPPPWTLDDVYSDPAAFRRLTQFFNYQARALLEPHFEVDADDELALGDGPGPNADLWRSRLRSIIDKWYVIGVQDHFSDSVRRFASEFGWERAVAPAVRVNRRRPRDSVDEASRELVLSHNWLDAELYQNSLERFEGSGATTS